VEGEVEREMEWGLEREMEWGVERGVEREVDRGREWGLEREVERGVEIEEMEKERGAQGVECASLLYTAIYKPCHIYKILGGGYQGC